jgi:hypothetical protein
VLTPGDVVTVRIVENAQVTPPTRMPHASREPVEVPPAWGLPASFSHFNSMNFGHAATSSEPLSAGSASDAPGREHGKKIVRRARI